MADDKNFYSEEQLNKLSAIQKSIALTIKDQVKDAKTLGEVQRVISSATDRVYDSTRQSLAAEKKILKVYEDKMKILEDEMRKQVEFQKKFKKGRTDAVKQAISDSKVANKKFASVADKMQDRAKNLSFIDEDKVESSFRLMRRKSYDSLKAWREASGGIKKSGVFLKGFFDVGKAGFGALLKSVSAFGVGLSIATAGVSAIAGGVVVVAKRIFQMISAIDGAGVSLAKMTGILDRGMDNVLLRATEQSFVLGGNVEKVAEYAASFLNQMSPTLDVSSDLISNIATIGEKFQLGEETASSFARIIAQTSNIPLDTVGQKAIDIIDQFGRIGPAVAKNIVQSFDEVSSTFDLTIKQLGEQGLRATNLGISLGQASKAAEGLLNFSSSISSEFRASALLGQQLNMNRARQLAFEGRIVESQEEILNQLGPILESGQLNFVQARAIKELTGQTVAELRRELRVRKNIGQENRIDARTREDALTRIDVITRKLQGALFKLLASPTFQNAFTRLTEGIEGLLDSKVLDKIIESIEKLFGLFTGDTRIGFDFFGDDSGVYLKSMNNNSSPSTVSVNDAVITPKGDVIKTNPRDYIMATTNPSDMVQSNQSSAEVARIMAEVRDLLSDLKRNGVTSNVYLDGRALSNGISKSIRI